jgi:CMP-N-acetylneuraminic acid synthetase
VLKEDLKILALIPARGGSKRLPGKNIKALGGKPLIAWTIEAALQSNVHKVVVSTDCEDIAAVAKAHHASVPFIRPLEHAQDESGVSGVIDHCLEFYAEQGESFSHILLLQPTCPLRIAADIDAAINLMLDKKASGVFSVCEVDHSPLWANTIPADGSFDDFLREEVAGVRSQELPTYYRVNGAIYLLSVEEYQKTHSLFHHKNTYSLIMPRERSVDIDEEVDFVIAEAIFNQKAANK